MGRAFAQALALAGAAVAVTARSPEQLNETVRLIESAGGRAVALVGDVADPEDVQRVVASVQQQLGPVDLLVNNAGMPGPLVPTWQAEPQTWWRTLEVNLRGPFLFTHQVLPG